MKHAHVMRALAASMALGLLVLGSPCSYALASGEDIVLDPEEGRIGDGVDVYGEYFDDYYEDVTIYFSDEEADEGDDIDDEVQNYEVVDSSAPIDEDGEWDSSFDVPDELTDGEDDVDVESGTYYVYVTYYDDTEIVAMAEFEIVMAEIELDPEEGPVGTEVEISGTGFTDGESITVEFDGDDVDIDSGDDDVDSRGEFQCTIVVPDAAAGTYTITVTDDADRSAEAEFTVEPDLTVKPTSITSADASITVTGTGFGERAEVTITLGGDEVATDDADVDGYFSVTFTAPDEVRLRSDSTSYIEAEDDEGNSAQVDVTIGDVMPVTTTVVTPPPTQAATTQPPTPTPPATTPPAQYTNPDESLPAPLAFIAGLGMPDWALYLLAGLALVVAVLIGYLLGRTGGGSA